MLVGSIHRARGLKTGARGVVDAYVSASIGSKKARTKVVKRTDQPRFDHDFRLPVADGTLALTIKVKNKGVLGNQLLGEATVPLVEIASRVRRAGTTRHSAAGCVSDESAAAATLYLPWRRVADADVRGDTFPRSASAAAGRTEREARARPPGTATSGPKSGAGSTRRTAASAIWAKSR